MSHITLPRTVVEQVREAFKELDYASEPYVNEIARTALATLDAALAEPEPDVADLFAQFAAKQKPLDADMAAILHANLDSLYITDEPDAALAEPEQKPDALRRWANANEDAPETEFQGGYDAARRWVREVGLPALAEPKKERAEVAAPARSGVGAGQTNAPTGEAYPTPQPDATREPVAWMYVNSEGECEQIEYETPPAGDDSITPLYAAPPEPDAKREPATEEVIEAKFEKSFYVHPEALDDFAEGWCEAERFHGIRKEDGK